MASNNGTVLDMIDPNTNLYGYIPSKPVAIIFFLLFSVTTLTHLAQAVKYRMWFLFATTILCGVFEMVGWASRIWSSFSPLASTPYKIQVSTTVLGPTPLLATNFVMFGRLVRALGERYSRLKPRRYTIIFTSFDIASLMLQGAGGGLAASASTSEGAQTGSNIILGGIIFQLIIIVIFSGFAVDYFIRYKEEDSYETEATFQMIGQDDRLIPVPARDAPGKFTTKLKIMTYAIAFATLCLFIRAVYRVIELAGGWRGRIIRTEIYFNVLDGMMIVLTMYTTNFVHPGIYLPPHRSIDTPSMS